jgi:hypothetical protein
MEKIYSKINGNLLHMVKRKSDIKSERENLSSDLEFLQCSSMNLPKGKTFKPHKHIWKDIKYKKIIAQESWVVVTGSVKVDYYDIDGSFISSQILKKGDCTITLQGGHNYTCLEKNTTVYEFKSGPYEGVLKDKVFI